MEENKNSPKVSGNTASQSPKPAAKEQKLKLAKKGKNFFSRKLEAFREATAPKNFPKGRLVTAAHHLEHILEIMEIVMAIPVIIGFILSFIPMIREMPALLSFSNNATAYRSFLEYAFNLVIGIEFVKMLIKHTPSSMLEVLSFALARHMIVEHTSSLESLLIVISIGIIFAIHKFIYLKSFDD